VSCSLPLNVENDIGRLGMLLILLHAYLCILGALHVRTTSHSSLQAYPNNDLSADMDDTLVLTTEADKQACGQVGELAKLLHPEVYPSASTSNAGLD